MNKHKRKPKGKSTMDNPEKLETLGILDTGGEQTKQKHNTENYKDEQHGLYQ